MNTVDIYKYFDLDVQEDAYIYILIDGVDIRVTSRLLPTNDIKTTELLYDIINQNSTIYLPVDNGCACIPQKLLQQCILVVNIADKEVVWKKEAIDFLLQQGYTEEKITEKFLDRAYEQRYNKEELLEYIS